eukprot:760931-Amphidinium_carterae.1
MAFARKVVDQSTTYKWCMSYIDFSIALLKVVSRSQCRLFGSALPVGYLVVAPVEHVIPAIAVDDVVCCIIAW